MKKEIQLNGEKVTLEIHKKDSKSVSFNWQGQDYYFEISARHESGLVLRDAGGNLHHLQVDGGTVSSWVGDAEFMSGQSSARAGSTGGGDLTAPMPGKVFKIMVKTGDTVKAGQTLLILEAMKMEHAIKSSKDGVVKKLLFKEGDLVQAGKALAEVE